MNFFVKNQNKGQQKMNDPLNATCLNPFIQFQAKTVAKFLIEN